MNNEFLRHTLATIAFRFQKAVEDTDESFGGFRVHTASQAPAEIIYQAAEKMGFTRQILLREEAPAGELPPLLFQGEIERFHNLLAEVEFLLKGEDLSLDYAKRLLQGPLADVLIYIGQLALLKELSQSPTEEKAVPSDQVLEA